MPAERDLGREVQEGLCRALSGLARVRIVTVRGETYARVATPLYATDGTGLDLFVGWSDGQYVVRDFGLTLMGLEAGGVKLDTEGTQDKLARLASAYLPETKVDQAELITFAKDDLGEALARFVQMLSATSSLLLDADIDTRFSFEDEVDALLSATFGERSVQRGWHDPFKDPDAAYRVDFRVPIEGKQPLMTFAVQSTAKVTRVALVFSRLMLTNSPGVRVVVCRDFEEFGKTDQNRLKDHADLIVPRLVGEDRYQAQELLLAATSMHR